MGLRLVAVSLLLSLVVVSASASKSASTSVSVSVSESATETGSHDWRFLDHAPPHYVTRRLSAGQRITMDGKLDDPAWEEVGYQSSPFVDISQHVANPELDAVVDALQVRFKVRWDADYLYIGCRLREPFVAANVSTGHNGKTPPYYDGDLEVFIDVSGEARYYKEYEMNALNATYDVLWGVPDGEGLNCSSGGTPTTPVLPTCVNTSFPGYPGRWSMFNAVSPGTLAGGGLVARTHYNASDWFRFVSPYTEWTAEIAFPIRSGMNHGGLLDAGPPYASDFSSVDPAATPQVYWHMDVARTEHPRPFTSANTTVYCPLYGSSNTTACAPELVDWTPGVQPLTTAQCTDVKQRYPTLLGVNVYSCYWSWVWSAVGTNAYLHRPQFWGVVEFVNNSAPVTPCRQVEWPGRYLMRAVFEAQKQSLASGDGFGHSMSAVVAVCRNTVGCPSADLAQAVAMPSVFSFQLTVIDDAPVLSANCTSRPCFTASVAVKTPTQDPYAFSVSIDSNSMVTTTHSLPPGQRPCL